MTGKPSYEDQEHKIRVLEQELLECRQAGLVLLEDFTKFRGLVEGLNEVLYRMSLPDGIYEYISPAAKDVLGYGAEEILARPFLVKQAIHPDFHDFFRKTMESILKGDVPPSLEYKIIDSAGKERWILQSNRGIFDDQGNIIAIEGLCRDITRSRKVEDDLRDSRQKFQGLVETLYDWVWEVDSQGRYTYVSPQVINILGYEPQEILGKTVYDLMPPGESKLVAEKMAALIREGKPIIALENINLHKDGRLVVLETNGRPYFDADGNLQGYRGTDRDITDRKREEDVREKLIAELRQALAKVRTLSGMLPICAACKKIRDDQGYWNQIESYIETHSDAEFSHGLCPECAKRLYPEFLPKK